ncbi:hypothetical protein GJAV_G00225970 [Gymnothorax javanicus]|nr:hypothetical protein GJAV_G00225970 [Gymnothorax javanicus]
MGKDQELLQAVKTEDLITVQKLLQRPKPGKAKLLGSTKKVNVNFQDLDGFAALHHAALNGNMELISLLLESQATVDIRDQKGMRPLHYAAWQGKAEPMKMLLKCGSSVNGQSDEGQIPLHLSAQHGHYDVSEMLLQHQSNPCIVDIAGKTPLDLACEFGRVGVVQLLLSSNMCAALLEPKPSDATDPNGTSPLHLAAKNGHIDIIRLLIQAGIDINRQTKAGTALHEAALCGKTEAVRLLLDSGINAAVKNTYNQTALDIVHQFTTTQASKEIKQLLREASVALQVRALKDYCNNYDLTSLNIKAGDIITVLEQHADGRWKGCIHDNRTGNDRVGYFPSSLVEVISRRTGSWNAVIYPQQFEKIQLFVPARGSRAAVLVNGDSSPQYHILPPPLPPPKHSHQPLFTSFGYSRPAVSPEEPYCGQVTSCKANQCRTGVKVLAAPSPAPTARPRSAAPPHGGGEEIWVLRKPIAGGDRGSGGSTASSGSSRSASSGQSMLHAQAEGVKLLATVLSQSAKAKEHLLEQSKSVELSTASSPRTQSSSSCLFHEQTYAEAGPARKGEGPPEGKDGMAPAVTKPSHRKKTMSDMNKQMSMVEGLPDHKPSSLAEWLSLIGLSQYYQVLVQNGYENIDFITDITWEDLQDIGITKLGKEGRGEATGGPYGHQKKLMVAVKKLAELQKGLEGRGGQRRKPSHSASEVQDVPMATHDTAETVMSPKLTSFQDSELSGELQAALSVAAQERAEPPWGRSHQENSLAKGRDSEEGGVAPRKEARVLRQSSHPQGSQRSNAPPTLKTRQSFPTGAAPCYTPPLTPTKAKPSSPQAAAPPAGKMKHHTPAERAARPPQSPTHRGHAHAASQPPESEDSPAPSPAPAPQVSVPLLCLPPEGEEPQGEQGTPKKRAHGLVRYAVSDGEQDREDSPTSAGDSGKHGTAPGRMGRSNSVRGQSEKSGGGGGRAQAIALRQRKKGPPPPPPKRSSSAISSPNPPDQPKEEARDGGVAGGGALLDVSYHQQRRASDVGGAVDTGSAGSVRSIAAMLEMSSIGGGAKALHKPMAGGGQHGLQASPERARLGVPPGGGKSREGVGLDGEVVNRRRTISGPVTELVAAARRGPQDPASGPAPTPPPPEQNLTSSAQDGGVSVRQRAGEDGVHTLPQDELSRTTDATATQKRRPRSRQQQQDGEKFQLTESSTVKRRPKSREKDPEPSPAQDNQLLVPYQNGTDTGTIKRRPGLEASGAEPSQRNGESAPYRESGELVPPGGESTPRKPAKPPVSPKPVLAQHMKKTGHVTAPPSGLGVTDGLGTAKTTATTPPSVPTSPPKPLSPPAQSPQTPQTPLTPQTPHTPSPTPPPVKPPRSSISGASMDSGSAGGPTDSAQQKLEETSASLAAALQAVEEKIKQDNSSVAQDKTTVSILDDIGSMFDDLADQLDAMLE